MANIGIMDPAFFVGKNVLLNWLNDTFDAGYNKVESMCTGAMACQIFDAIYPGKVALSKVNFEAKTEAEYVANFKVLQACFDSEQIPKYIDVPKLIKGKYMDNLEFLQWIKQYFDKNYTGGPYDAKARREAAKLAYKKGRSLKAIAAPVERKPVEKKAAPLPVAAASKPAAAASRPAAAASAKSPSSSSTSNAEQEALIAELNAQVQQHIATIEGLEKERNFYFGKLREVEILSQEVEFESTTAMKEKILEVLYKTDDNQEFVAPDEDGAGAAAGAAEDGGDAMQTEF